MKRNILRRLRQEGFKVHVVPADMTAEDVLALKPDGVFLSNGPGDPAALGYVHENLRDLMGKTPIFGICLGHQMLGYAFGGKTFKLKFGHRGGNQPVKDLATGKVTITSQNHGFAVDPDSLPRRCGSDAHQSERPDRRGHAASRNCRFSACSITPRPRRDRTMRATFSSSLPNSLMNTARAASLPPMPQIQVTLPDGTESSHELTESLITLGRVDDNMIQIDDASVSSHHAQFARGRATTFSKTSVRPMARA